MPSTDEPGADVDSLEDAGTTDAGGWYTGSNAGMTARGATNSTDSNVRLSSSEWGTATTSTASQPSSSSAPVPSASDGAGLFPGHCPVDERTGLGVAGMLRRVGLHGDMNAGTGRIVVKSEEVGRWLRHAFGSALLPDAISTVCAR